MSKEIFKKVYDSESLYDLGRDIEESLDEDFNPIIKEIPQDENFFSLGRFTVTVTWEA